jgi:hypothetical protein
MIIKRIIYQVAVAIPFLLLCGGVITVPSTTISTSLFGIGSLAAVWIPIAFAVDLAAKDEGEDA